MLRVATLSASLIAAVALVALAQDNPLPEPPPGPPDREPRTEAIPPDEVGVPHEEPPQHALASVAEGQLYLIRFSFRHGHADAVVKIESDGKTSAESILRQTTDGSFHTSWHDLSNVFAYADGVEIPSAQLAKRLAKTTHVLIAAKQVDPFYLDLIKPGTIQLVLPAPVIEENFNPTEPASPYGAAPFYPSIR